jgi:hypothetical protein
MTAVFYHGREPTKTGPEPYRSTEHNYSLLLPGPEWQRGEDSAKRLGGVLAFHRENPDAQAVFVVRRYPKYVPTAAELRDEAIARLRRFPIDNLQYDDKLADITFAGRPAQRFVFQGAIDGTIVSGDVVFLPHQGAAYWLYRWCPATAVEQAAPSLAELADRFGLLDLHAEWRPPRRTFIGTKAKYALTAEGDRWDKAPYPPENYDAAADLALIGKPQDGASDPVRQAQLLVVILPAGDGDPVERARAHVLARQKDLYEETTMADLPPTDENSSAGGSLRILAFRTKNTKDRERFAVVGVAPRKEGPIVIWAECDFGRRAIWESDFRKLIGSFALDK